MTSSATTSSANTSSVEQLTHEQLVTLVTELNKRVEALEAAQNSKKSEQREMTDADALAILTGQYKDLNHSKAADALKLSYGQVYSCRLQYTFRHIHKDLESKGYKNPWKK